MHEKRILKTQPAGGKGKSGINDLTEGIIWKQLIIFAIPLLGSSLIQQLYNTVDLIFVGKMIGTEASAAVGASGLLITCLVGFFTGLSIGTSVTVSHAFGSNDHKRLHRIVHTAAAISLGGGLIVTVLGLLIAPAALRLLNTPSDIFNLANTYIKLYFLSITSIISYNMGAGILRALGDSKTPMICQLIGGIGNVFANTICIAVLKLGVRGAAYATIISQTTAAVLVAIMIMRLDPEYALRLKKIRIYMKEFKQILTIGVPAGIQSMIITFSNLVIQANINRLGTPSIAAFAAYFKVELFIYLPILSIGQASTTFVGQNAGAGKIDRIRKGVNTTILMGIVITLAMSGLILTFSRFAFGMFLNDAQVIEIGRSIAWTAFPLYFIYVFLETYSGAARGLGKSVPPMIITIVCICVLRVAVLTLIMKISPTAAHAALVYPITWFAASVCHFFFYRYTIKKIEKTGV